jgi:hypothetical protein
MFINGKIVVCKYTIYDSIQIFTFVKHIFGLVYYLSTVIVHCITVVTSAGFTIVLKHRAPLAHLSAKNIFFYNLPNITQYFNYS